VKPDTIDVLQVETGGGGTNGGPPNGKAPSGGATDARSKANSEMLEDYSLRYAPRSYRKWTEFAVANTALGGIAYLADFAIGGSLAVTFGFRNALFAVLLAATVIFLTSFPIAYYAAKYNIDMDLITRGSGFG
jgi:cytosine/uracil/thiamine/allantoin permease